MVWFDSEMANSCGFSNAPGVSERNVYGQAFFPWSEPRDLVSGDRVVVDIRADPVGSDYIWCWNTEIRGDDGDGPVKARFRQSQLTSVPISKDWMRKCNGDFVPSPTRDAEIDGMILDLFSTGVSLEAISRRVAARFPDRFSEWPQALTRAGELSFRYRR